MLYILLEVFLLELSDYYSMFFANALFEYFELKNSTITIVNSLYVTIYG